jgi:hypothetical protein
MPTSQISEGTINGASQRTIAPWPYGEPTMSFTFKGTAGLPPVRRILTFSVFTGASASAYWDFGDNSGMQQVASPNHTYASAGSYNVKRYGDPTGPTAWTYSANWGGLSGIKVGLTHLTSISLSTATSDAVTIGLLDLTGCLALTSLAITLNSGSGLTGLNLTGCSALTTIAAAHSALTTVDISPCPLLGNVNLSYNGLTMAVVDGILNTLAAGSVNAGTATLQYNAAPSSASVTAHAILLSRGWTVVTA